MQNRSTDPTDEDVRQSQDPVEVAVLGATGTVGQRFVALLETHPWFELVEVAASRRRLGERYRDSVDWTLPTPLPAATGALRLTAADVQGIAALRAPLVFSALDGSVALEVEEACRAAGKLVVSNASAHRMHPRVPLLVPEVNADHLALVDQRQGAGAIVANPNCSTAGLVLALAPLQRAFGIEAVHVVTMQALSGAGRPGVPAMDALGNIVPFIRGEEEKLAQETGRILGRLEGDAVVPDAFPVSAQCHRVPVRDGHFEAVAVRLGVEATAEDLLDAWRTFRGLPQELELPSAPTQVVEVHEHPAHPQPVLHRDLGGGMSASVGRLQPCPVLGWKFVCLSHNTLRGAAGGAILAAETVWASGRWRPF